MGSVVAFTERFTVYRDSDGGRVEKPLAEMTAAEVGLALAWAQGEQRRLSLIAAPWPPGGVELGRGLRVGDLRMRREDHQDVEALRAAGEAALKLARLLVALHAAPPPWVEKPRAFEKALRGYWPWR